MAKETFSFEEAAAPAAPAPAATTKPATFSFEEAATPPAKPAAAATFSFEEAAGQGSTMAPAAVQPKATRATDSEIDQLATASATPGSAAGQINAAPAPSGKTSAIGEELGQLRDEFFTGVDNTRAALKTVNVAAQANQLQQAQNKLASLESQGAGASPEAAGLRKTIEHYSARLPKIISGMTEAQADAQRGSQMTTRPAVAALNSAKTFGEAWDVFKSNPYDVIAGVSATSLPTMLPALVTGAVMGPAAGAITMGGSSAVTEAGSSLADFAREAGVNTTNPQQVQAFFEDHKNLADAMAYAGKRAGIIGALDMASGGVASKTLAPAALKNQIARQAVNLPAQMAVQAGLGAGGEAGGQLATKGTIDQPGQVLAEAAGELAGAPSEVVAFSKDARSAIMGKPAVDQRVQRLRDAGEKEAADLLEKRIAAQRLPAEIDRELASLQLPSSQMPEFQDTYRGLRTVGVKPAEAAARTAVITDFRAAAAQAGMSDKAIAAALDAGQKKGLADLPTFLHRFTQSLASRGAMQAVDIGPQLEAARDAGLDAATQSLYGDTRQTMDAAQALESGQNQAPAVDNTAPKAMNSVAPMESVQAVDNIERILGQQTTRPDIDQAAHAAATSPLNDLPQPTQAQKEAGNYQKGHINLHGLDIAIENPQGSERRGISPDGTEWSSTLASHYGYFKRTNGNDGDHVDTFIGPNPDSTKVFVVDQLNKDGSFDEHKVMLGFDSLEEADRGYHANYEPGWTGRGAITEVPLPAFKSWVRDGKKKEPISAIQFKTQEAGQGQGAAGTETTAAPDTTADAGNGVEGGAARAVQPTAAADFQPGADQHPAVELSGKTPAQLAAMERAAKRLRLPHTGSGPLSAHAFIAAEGGLSRAAMADTGFDANVRVGNRWLFAAPGKGLTLEQAAMKLAQAGYLPAENESDAADLIRRSMTQPQYTAEGWQALAEAEAATRYEDHLAAQQEADTGDDPLAPEGFTDAELEQSGYDDASPEVQAEVRALLATAEDQDIDAEFVLENVAKTTENATQQAYYEAAKRALETAIAAQPGNEGDQRPPAGSESPAPGQEAETGPAVTAATQQTPADAGVSVSGFTVEPRADGTLAVKGDAKAIREALSAIPAKLLVTMKGGILVGRTQAEKAQAILRGEQPKPTAREAAEAGERARQAEKKARQQAARAESTAAPAGLSIGIMPSTAEAVTVRDGVVFIGDNEAIGYESGEPVTVAAGASDQQIVDALKEAGALSRRQRVFGLAKAEGEGLTAPTREDVIAQQDRAETAPARDQREQVRKESEAGAGQFSLTQEDGRQDTTGSLFDQPAESIAPVTVRRQATSEKIEDLGEKIGGARKDTATPTGRAPRKTAETDNRPAWARRFQISQIVRAGGQIGDMRDEGRWVIRDTRSLDWRKQPKQVGRETFASREAAEKALPLLAVAQKHRVVPATGPNGAQAWEIWRDISDRKRVKVVDLQFGSRDDAMRYMAEHATEIIEANTTFGEADLPVPENKQRIGAERRQGDVKGEDFRTAFGFRGVEFGNWNNQDERQQLMNEAYDGLMDLAEVMGIPPKAISLNGDLALAFGARGHGLSGARAHYEPDRAVMNLTKMKGAGALAHEWFHAVDHYFGRQDGKAPVTWVTNKDGTRSLKVHRDFESNAVSSGFSRMNSGVREEVRAAYAKVMTTMARKAEQYVEDTAKTERFVAAVRNDVDQQLTNIRRDLAEQKDVRYYKRNNKPASAEQLAEFDAIAQRILAGETLDTELRSATGAKTLTGMRWTNDALEQIGAIYKAVRGRSGFDADQNGTLDRLRQEMGLYSARLKMLAEAQNGEEKTKKVPTDFAMDAKSLDQGRGTDYWITPHEMAARAFQGYVEDKIGERGGKSPFLNYAPENAGILTPWGAKRPYPAGEERKAINAAFDKLVDVIETRETDQGVAMYARGGVPDLLPVDDDTEALVQEYGEPVGSILDAERRHATGERIFAMHEQDETISEITSVRQLKAWAPDQLVAVHRGVFEEAADQTETPAFRKWFGDSKVVDDQGKPLVVYRGEHGGDGQPRTTLASYTFVDDAKVASTYAMSPNDTRNFMSAESPKVIPAFLSIQKPIIENRDDPFVEFSDLAQKLGRDTAIKFARKHSDWIQNTNNWEENFAVEYDSVDALLDANPSAVSELYMDAYPLLDDFAFVGAAKDAGFDGAIHVGNGESMDAVEYRVFRPEQIKSAIGNRGTFDHSSADITMARGMSTEAFLRAFAPPASMTVDRANEIVDKITATWENGPDFKVVATPSELPINAPADARGLIHNGTAYVVAANNPNRDAIAQTLAHEAIGHYGLWKILGKDGKAKFERNLQMALKTGNKPLAKIRDKVRRLYVDDTGKFNLSPAEEANEIAAFAVEEAVDPVTGEFTTGMSWLKEFWAQIADFLRGLGLSVKFTKAELHGLLVASMKGLQAGHRLDGGAEVLVAAARDASPEGKALQALSENDDLFALPRSDKTTVEGIAADNDPDIKVEKSKSIAETLYTLTMPDGRHALIWVRPANPYGERAYSMELNDGEVNNLMVGRPGENPEAVDPSVEDVYLDVSGLKEGSGGNVAYNIAATFAHNTDRIFIGDPTGLSDAAMRRRTEHMLSSALKFGTTRHLAPHPRQVRGDAKIGVPPMRWTYGDDMGNIQELIKTSLKSAEYAVQNPITFDPQTGTFRDSAGRVVDDSAIQSLVKSGRSDASRAGVATYKRSAVLSALVREESGQGGGTGAGAGILAQLVDVGRQHPASTKGIFYARGQAGTGPTSVTPPAGTPPTSGTVQGGLFTPTVWNTPDPTRADRIIYELQDGRIDLKRIQQAIEKSGQQIAEQWDARLAETLYPGRVAYRSHAFLDNDVKPLLKSMAVNKVDMAELSDYLHARGAEERNAQIAKVNPNMPDGGAGKNSKGVLMTTQAARNYLAVISPTRKMVLDAMAKRVDAITDGTRKLLVAEGLEKQETIDAWEKAYKNYVPMFRDEAESGNPHPQGTGFAVKGSASRRATGSTKQVTNMLAHVLMQREAVITRAEKNRVALALYGQALSHPNPDFWTTIKPSMSNAEIAAELQAMGVDPATATLGMERAPTIRTVDDATGKVIDRPNPMYRNLPGAIPLKVNGEDRVLMLNTADERGQRLAESLKNLDGLTKLDIAGNIVGKSTRWLAAVNTQYNPAFGLVNLTRDTLGGAINLGSTELRGNALKVLSQTPAAIFGIARELATGKQTGKWGKLYRQFVADGGQTGWKENWRDPHERARALEKELKSDGKLTPGKAAHAILDLLDGFNTTLENAVRLSAYSAGLDKGLSRAEAARLGRELTVDFNRKGRAGREIGPLYAFFNASVQGTARTIQTLKGPTGAKVIAGGLGLGILQALMLAAAGYDDDEIPEFVKARALIIPMPGEGKQFISIPYPLGLHVIPNTGRVLAELVLNGGKDIGKRSVEAIGEIAAGFNPLGGGNVLTAHGVLTTIAPTLVDPIIDLAANKNFAGNPIEREARGEADNRPGAARAKESTQRSTTGQVYIGISEAINRMTGGSQYEAGSASPTPERIRYLAQTAGGGVLRELEKGINAGTAAARGDKVKSSQIPVIGRFYGEVDADQVQASRYFENKGRIKKAESSFKAMEKAGDAAALEKFVKDHPEVLMADNINEMQKAISELNRLAVTVINDPKTMTEIDAARAELMKGANGVVKEMETMSDKQQGRSPSLGERLRARATAPAN